MLIAPVRYPRIGPATSGIRRESEKEDILGNSEGSEADWSTEKISQRATQRPDFDRLLNIPHQLIKVRYHLGRGSLVEVVQGVH